MGASEVSHGPLGILHYKEEDPLTPYIYFFADGVQRAAAPGRSTSSLGEAVLSSPISPVVAPTSNLD